MPHDPAPAPAPDRHQLRGDLAAVPAAGRLASCAPGCGEHWRQMASLATAARSNKAYCAPRTDQGPQTVGEERQITAAAPAGGGGVMAGGRAASRAGGRLWRSRLTLCDAMMTAERPGADVVWWFMTCLQTGRRTGPTAPARRAVLCDCLVEQGDAADVSSEPVDTWVGKSI